MTRALIRVALTLGLVLHLAGVAGVSAPVTHADPQSSVVGDEYNPVVVVLDTSGSMSDRDASGTERIVGARSAVLGLVDALPPQSPFALVAYPGNGARVVDGCSEGKVEIKLGPLDQPTAAAAVRRLSADGQTPTAPALRHAARIIQSSLTQRGTVVLVSDGESNCGSTDVCAVAKELSEQGVEVRVNTVGFQISEGGADELTCIANTTGGRYVDAEDKQQLEDAVQELSGARLTLGATVPNPLSVVSGTGAEGPKAILTVANEGRKTAKDVRLSLDFRDRDGRPGALLVPRPIRFLGNLDPGQKRTVEVTVRPDAPQRGQQFTWTAAVTATNAKPQRKEGDTTTAEPKLDGLLAGVEHIAILGDSYSSGEGAGAYQNGTDGEPNGNSCHRSDNAYGKVLVKDADPAAAATLIACSGAVTADFYGNQVSGGAKVEPQLKRLRSLALSDRSLDAVLLSIGGNDVDFAGTVFWCIVAMPGQTCARFGPIEEGQFRTGAAGRIAAVADSLRRVYRDINRAVNDPQARAKRAGKYAPIIVVPYPRIVPSHQAGAAAAGGCHLNINAGEVKFFNDFIDMLNLEIGAAAGSVRSDGVPIYLAADVVSAFQPNHTICDAPDNYVNFTKDLWGTYDFEQRRLDPEQLHPNERGNAAMARAISTYAADKTMMTDPAEVTWVSIDAKKLGPVTNAVANATLSAADLYLIGGEARIDADGFAPSSTIVFRLDSTPRTLGSATVSADGSISTHVPVPVDIRPGNHHLHVLGIDPDGQLRDVAIPVRIAPPHTLGALLSLAVGLVAVGVGVIGMRRNRRRRSR